MAGEERRKDPRVPLRVQAEVRFSSWHVFSLIYTINISKGGMNIELENEPKVGALLHVRLAPPDGKPLELDAIVRHVQPGQGGRFSAGIEFQGLDAPRRDAIERAIRAHGGTLQAHGLTPRK